MCSVSVFRDIDRYYIYIVDFKIREKYKNVYIYIERERQNGITHRLYHTYVNEAAMWSETHYVANRCVVPLRGHFLLTQPNS